MEEHELKTDEHKEIFRTVHEKKIPDLEILNMPYKCRKEFKDFARAEFMGHYGFAFKQVWDVFKGGMEVLNTNVVDELTSFNERLTKLEEAVKAKETEAKKKEEVVVMMDGTKLKKESEKDGRN